MRQIIFSRMTAGLLAFCLGSSIQMTSAQPASDAPFAALRFGYRYTNPDKWPAMRKALEKNTGAFDEIRFSTGVSFPPLSWHEEHARQCAEAAADLRRMGIVPSIEIQTVIGHTDDILETGDCSGQDWGTMVSAEGLAARRLSCPRDPKLIAYFTRVAELHAAWKPGSVWVDDDMSYRNRAPLRNPRNNLPGCFCDRCLAGFSAAEGRRWERDELARQIRADESVRRRWDDFSCAGFAEVTRAIAAAVHRVSPETVMGYQYGGELRPAIPKGLFDGCELPVRLRPGAGAYWDTDPHLQLGKSYRLQHMLLGVRGEPWGGRLLPGNRDVPPHVRVPDPAGNHPGGLREPGAWHGLRQHVCGRCADGRVDGLLCQPAVPASPSGPFVPQGLSRRQRRNETLRVLRAERHSRGACGLPRLAAWSCGYLDVR